MKENHALKYLNAGSQHTKSCFKAILSGVFQRLSKLTMITTKNKDKTIGEIYPNHAAALRTAGLADAFPTLDEISKELNAKTSPIISKAEARSRRIYFCIGVSDTWKTPVHAILKKSRENMN